MSIYIKTSSGTTELSLYGFSEVYEKTSSGTALLYQSSQPVPVNTYLLNVSTGDNSDITGGWIPSGCIQYNNGRYYIDLSAGESAETVNYIDLSLCSNIVSSIYAGSSYGTYYIQFINQAGSTLENFSQSWDDESGDSPSSCSFSVNEPVKVKVLISRNSVGVSNIRVY